MQSFGGDGGIEHSCVVNLSFDVFFFLPKFTESFKINRRTLKRCNKVIVPERK